MTSKLGALGFFSVTALALSLAACATEEVDAGETDGGSVGSGGAVTQGGSGGTGGSSASGGAATGGSATGGTAVGGTAGTGAGGTGAGGTGGTAGSGGSGAGACTSGDSDNMIETPALDCASLPDYTKDCGGDVSLAAYLCDEAAEKFRSETARAVLACLQGIAEPDVCSADHDTAAGLCFFKDGAAKACKTTPLDLGGTPFGCPELVGYCAGDLNLLACENVFYGLTEADQGMTINCFLDANDATEGQTCAEPGAFDICLFNTDAFAPPP